MQLSLKSRLRILFAAMIMAVSALPASALPGVASYIQDTSGEYVYYKDSSFERYAIVGFLYYNEGTYALRYYAPTDIERSLPEQEVILYVTVNPQSSSLELTGERIIGGSDNETTDIINYLHDLFYDFTAQRQASTVVSVEETKTTASLDNFGGLVSITYTATVPIFNIESIQKADGTYLLQTLTTGQLTSSSDDSFTSFKGFEDIPTDKKRAVSLKTKAKNVDAAYQSQHITLDEQWEQSAGLDNLWLLGDNAILTLNIIAAPEKGSLLAEKYHSVLIRKLCQSTDHSFAVWPKHEVTQQDGSTRITNKFYQPVIGNVTRDFKIITELEDGSYAFMTLTVFDSVFQNNQSYFEKILGSYEVTE